MSDYALIVAGIALALVAGLAPVAGWLYSTFARLACGLADSSVCLVSLVQ